MVKTLVFGLCLFGLPAIAQTIDCQNEASQMALNMCSYRDWEASDVELNQAYKAAMAAMKRIDADLPKSEQGAAEALRAGQRAWITVRDETCKASGYLMHGGTAEPMIVSSCKADLTRARSATLWDLVQDP